MATGETPGRRRVLAATLAALGRATELGLATMAFPAISTGIFGFPVERCAAVMLSAVKEYLERETTSLREVTFCLFSAGDFATFEAALKGL